MENWSDDDFAQDNSTQALDPTSLDVYQVGVFLWKVCSPCILLLGGFGNIATVVVMRRIKDQNSSQYAILMALAVSDVCLLYVGVSREWIRHVFHVDVRNMHTLVCKFHKWLLYGFNTTSAWLVTCVTVQRTMAVLWPHRMRMVCTVRRTWIVIATLVLTVFILYSHLALGMDTSTYNRCDATAGLYEYFYRHVFTWVDLCLSSLLPSVCLLICDVILSFTLFKVTTTSSKAVQAISNVSGQHNSRRKRASRTTVMVLTLSCTFFALTMPVYGFYVYWYQDVDAHVNQSPQVIATLKLVSTVTHILWYTNSTINFLLYCLIGAKYRREFLSLFHCGATSGVSAGETSGGGALAGERNTHCDSTQLSTLS